MKRLLRARTTEKFLTNDGGWSGDLSKAPAFKNLSEMGVEITRLNLLDVEVYYCFCCDGGSRRYDFAMPLGGGGNIRRAILEHSKGAVFRVLLRQGQEYLQISGKWSGNRETARQFAGPLLAYWWAKEQELLGTEVVMAFADSRLDFVPLRP